MSLTGTVKPTSSIGGEVGGFKGSVMRDYNVLENKPMINGVELSGSKTAEELGITADIENSVTSALSEAYESGKFDGADGTTYTPKASAEGNTLTLGWINDGGLENPEPVTITAPKGEKGDTGAQGIQGEKGEKGDTGAQGIQGEKGEKGDTGAQGIQGEKGEKGDTGAQGIQGEKGEKGDTGAQGIQGEKGEKGDTGASGAPATINGVNALTISGGAGIKAAQNSSNLNLSLDGDYLSNPNLLINSDFRINQRGASSYTAAGYSVDCWKLSGALTVGDSGIDIGFNSGTTFSSLIQTIERPYSDFSGKKVALSINIGGTVYSSTYTFGEIALSDKIDIGGTYFSGGYIDLYKYANAANMQFRILITAATSDIRWVKLEFGEPTAYTHPDTASELAKCQRYALALNQFIRYGASMVSVNYIDFLIPTPSTMRVAPTIDTSKLILYQQPSTAIDGVTFSVLSVSGNGFMIRATKASHGLSWAYLSLTENLIATADM